MIPILAGAAAAIGVLATMMIRVLREYERAVVFRLGRLRNPRGPGLVILWPSGWSGW